MLIQLLDLWDEKGDPEYEKEKKKRKEKRPDQTQTGQRIYCECFFFIILFVSKWGKKRFVSQNDFKSISGSVEQRAVSDDYDDGVGGGLTH